MATHAPITGASFRAPNLLSALVPMLAGGGELAALAALSRPARTQVADLIETLIDMLDQADGDPDVEDDDDDRCLACDDGGGPVKVTAIF